MKSIDVCGVCNGLVDIFADITDAELERLAFEKGTMRLVEAHEQTAILQGLGARQPIMRSGGSVANSVIAVAQLGGSGAMLTRLGQDEYGTFYSNECDEMGIVLPVPLASDGATGTVVSLVTPDAERTMRTSLGVCTRLGADHIDASTIERSKWLFVEGYVFSNSDEGRAAIKEAIDVAIRSNTKVAITCSEPWVVQSFGEPMWRALEKAQLVFANEEEAYALSGTTDLLAAGRVLKEKFPHVVITAGPKGAYLWWEGEELHVRAYPCEPRDLTGAGDMFAGAFLYGVTHGYTPVDAAGRACFLAREVISQVGARLMSDVKSLWSRAEAA